MLKVLNFICRHSITDLVLEGGEYGTALQVASYFKHFEITKLLIEKGADPNIQGKSSGFRTSTDFIQHSLRRYAPDGVSIISIRPGTLGNCQTPS
jgi:ankyrin repeat protein